MEEKNFGISNCMFHIIAMMLMVIDHIGYSKYYTISRNTYIVFRALGRISFIMFAFTVANGYNKTHCKEKYILKLLIASIISEIPFRLFAVNNILDGISKFKINIGNGIVVDYGISNVMMTLLLATIMNYIIDKRYSSSEKTFKHLILIICFILIYYISYYFNCDYGIGGIIIIMIMNRSIRIMKDASTKKKIAIRIIEILEVLITIKTLINFGITIVIPVLNISIDLEQIGILAYIPILMYNNRRFNIESLQNNAKASKILSYINFLFYPLHMLIIALLIQ